MTVVSYLKLSKDSGMGCADERETHGFLGGAERTYDVSRKIFQIGQLPIFVGTAGNISPSRKIIHLCQKKVQSGFTYDDVLEMLESTYTEVRDDTFRKGLHGMIIGVVKYHEKS